MFEFGVFEFVLKYFRQNGISIFWRMFKNIHIITTSQIFVLLSWSFFDLVFFETCILYTSGHTPTNACAIWLQYFSSKANTLSSITLMEFRMLPEEESWLCSGLWNVWCDWYKDWVSKGRDRFLNNLEKEGQWCGSVSKHLHAKMQTST